MLNILVFRINLIDQMKSCMNQTVNIDWYFVTFVTYNSRISERMIQYNSFEFIKELKPLIFSYTERILITEIILDQCNKYQIKVAGINVLPDHVHMVIAASDIEDLNNKVKLIKGGSSFLFKRTLSYKKNSPRIWATSYHLEVHKTEIDLRNILHYINNNHFKHSIRWGDKLITEYDEGLKPLIDKACVEIDSIY